MGSNPLSRYRFIGSPISIQRLSAFDTSARARLRPLIRHPRVTELYPPFTGDRVIPAESRFSRMGNRTIINRHILITVTVEKASSLRMGSALDGNQELAVQVLKDMVPASAARVWSRSVFLRLLFLLPGKKWILRRLLKDVQRSVDEAANAIRWKDYPKIPSDAAYYTTSRPGMPWQTTTTALLQIADL